MVLDALRGGRTRGWLRAIAAGGRVPSTDEGPTPRGAQAEAEAATAEAGRTVASQEDGATKTEEDTDQHTDAQQSQASADASAPVDPADELDPAAELDPADELDPAAEFDAAAVVEKGEPLPDWLDVAARPLNRRSPFYFGFIGALGVLLAIGLVQALMSLSQVLLFLLVAVFLALGLNPMVEALTRRGLTRGWAVLVVFLGLCAVFAGIGFLVVPPVVNQTQNIVTQAPHWLTDLQHNRVFQRLDAKYQILSHAQTELQTRLTSGSVVGDVFGGILGAGKVIVDAALGVFTVLVLTLYLLAALPQVKAAGYRLVPISRRTRVVQLSEEISRRVGSYVMGQAAVATINGLLCFTMLMILGLPFPAVIAVLVAILGLIPIFGTPVGGAIVVLVSLAVSWQKAAIMLGYYVVYHLFEGYVLSPRVMSRAVDVPPAVTVVAILAGGTLLGLVGALISIPVAAGLLLIYKEVIVPRQQSA